MKVELVSIEDGIIALGFRKLAGVVKDAYPDCGINYVSLTQPRSLTRILSAKFGDAPVLTRETVREIAEPLAKADLVGFSAMTGFADFTKRVITEIRDINPKTYIVWGGIHPIVHPEDAILSVDAICTGEGEYPFLELLGSFKEGKDFSKVLNFWFNNNGTITRNDFRSLNTSEDMSKFAYPIFGKDENFFKKGQGFVPLSLMDHLDNYGVSYTTIWSLGCPFKCSFCANSKFIENDKDYRKLRFSSVEYLMGEVKNALKIHPFVSSVAFHDDSFMSIPKDVMKEFAAAWKKEIKLPFLIQGLIPSFVQKDKMEILVDAGMNRVRMGIQSGSDRILKFYQRPNKTGLLQHATSIIAQFLDYILPPQYDIIVDNPIETRQDILDTLELMYGMPRPFNINVYALKVIPNTELERQFLDLNIEADKISSNYVRVAPTFANVLVYLLILMRPSRKVFDYLLKYVKPFTEKQPQFPILLFILRSLMFVKRGLYHLRYMDFSIFLGRTGWVLWKLGVIGFWNKRVLKRYAYSGSTH